MKTETLVTTLTSLTTAMAVVAPFVVFGFLYVVRVQPERAAADRLHAELTTVRDEVNRRRSVVRPSGAVTEAGALDEFDARTPQSDRAWVLRTALAALLNGPDVGGVSHLTIESRAAAAGPLSPLVRPFSIPVVQTPVRVAFEARFEQIGRFFSHLRATPATFDLQSVEIIPLKSSSGGLMRATISLLAFERAPAAGTREPARPQAIGVPTASQRSRDPVVSGIVFSSGRRVALVDGVMVSRGDQVGSSVVLSIEPDAVTLAEPGGAPRRIAISRPDSPAPIR